MSHRLRQTSGQRRVARRGVHRHHPRLLPIAAASLPHRGRPAAEVHDGRRADVGRAWPTNAPSRPCRRCTTRREKQAGDRGGVDGDRLVRGNDVPSRSRQGHRQRLVAVHRRRLLDRPMSIEVAHSTVMRMLDQVAVDDPRYIVGLRERCATRSTPPSSMLAARCEFVDSVPALARAATKLNDVLPNESSRGRGSTAAMRYACFEPALSRLMAALAPIVIEAAHDRIARGELSFDDLLVLTRRLLQIASRHPHRHPGPPSPPVRRRVPGHRSGAVRRADRADLADAGQSAVVDVRGRRPQAVDLRLS